MSTTTNAEPTGTGNYPTTRSSMVAGLKRSPDDPSWDRLNLQYRHMLRGMARRQGLSDHEADDVVQNTLIAVLNCVNSYDPRKGRFTTWLIRIAKCRIIDQFRGRKRTGPYLDPLPGKEAESSVIGNIVDPTSLEPNAAEAKEWAEEVLNQGCARLKAVVRSSKQYQIFEYHIRHGLKVGQTAEQLDVQAARVSWVVFWLMPKFRKAVRQVLEKVDSARPGSSPRRRS